jgi:hypothetical protein
MLHSLALGFYILKPLEMKDQAHRGLGTGEGLMLMFITSVICKLLLVTSYLFDQ